MKQEPRQLLDDTFIAAAYESYGDVMQAWPDYLKDKAVQTALRGGTREQLNGIMYDFWANHCLLPLYESKVNDVKNNVYAYLEHFMQLDVDDWVAANITPRLRSVK